MAEEDINPYSTTSNDDITALRVLLHSIKGISPVSTTDFVFAPVEDNDSE